MLTLSQYKDKSFEELRSEDYQLGRKSQVKGTQVPLSGGGALASSVSGAGSAFSSTPAPSASASLALPHRLVGRQLPLLLQRVVAACPHQDVHSLL